MLTNSNDEINKRPFKIILFSISHKESVINNKMPFLSALIDTNNIDRFITCTNKKKKTYYH